MTAEIVALAAERSEAAGSRTTRQRSHNPLVAGSSPAGPTKQTCSPGHACVFATEDLQSGPNSSDYQQNASELCESPAPLSHIGFGTCVPLFDRAPAPGRQWLYLCPTESPSLGPNEVMTCAQPSQGGGSDEPEPDRMALVAETVSACRCRIVRRARRLYGVLLQSEWHRTNDDRGRDVVVGRWRCFGRQRRE